MNGEHPCHQFCILWIVHYFSKQRGFTFATTQRSGFFLFFFCLLLFYSKNYLPEHLFKSRTAVHLALIVKDKNIHTHKFFCTTLHHFPFFSHLLRFIFIMDQFFLVFFFCLVVCYLSL